MPSSVRHLQSMKDTMLRYHSEIKRLVDSADLVCYESSESEFRCPLGPECPFKRGGECMKDKMKEIVGSET
jgi:hypothetical protein